MTQATLLSRFMPRFGLRQIDHLAVAADPVRAWEAARNLDFYRVPFVRHLFDLRVAPDRLRAWARGQRPEPALTSRIEDITRSNSGFLVLGETAGQEVVVGSVGKFWQPAITFARVVPADFAAFETPGFGKLAWCIRVDPRLSGGAWITVELRVAATDEAAWRKFRRYWRLIGPFSHRMRRDALRMLGRELGPAEPEATRPLPGDELIARPGFHRTLARTIEAPVEDVWPWLVQMGADRAGWYSFDLIDHGGRPSADRIHPELQSLSVGDVLRALPQSPGGFSVLALEPNRALVLGDASFLGRDRAADAPPWRTTWSFVLEPIGAEATRLVVRGRADFRPSLKMAVIKAFFGAAHEVMERRQLQNLKRRAEHLAAAHGG